MAFELSAYGTVAGLMHKLLPRKKPYIYVSLLISMLVGRVVWGAAAFILLEINGGEFTFEAFLSGAFVNAFPGIIVQIVLIPILVMLCDNLKSRNEK